MHCLTEECNGKHYSRGVCKNCYGTTRTMVVNGETTWSEQEKLRNVLSSAKERKNRCHCGEQAAMNGVCSLHRQHGKCIVQECTRPSQHRGLCEKHYQPQGSAVKLGYTTWKELESKGLAIAI